MLFAVIASGYLRNYGIQLAWECGHYGAPAADEAQGES